MFYRIFLLLSLGVACTLAVPAGPQLISRARRIPDKSILQLALTLENLESAFYQDGLDDFDNAAFMAAGFSANFRGRFQQITDHEGAHVEVLSAMIGPDANKPCNYTFPYNDVKSWVALALILESVGATFYLGAEHLIKNKDTLTAAGSFLATEARHASWIATVGTFTSPWDGPFQTVLTFNGVWSLASPMIVSCPSTNAPLPVTPLPNLTVTPPMPKVKDTVTLTVGAFPGFTLDTSKPLFAVYYEGLSFRFSDITVSKSGSTTTLSTVIPDNMLGMVFIGIVNSNQGTPSDATTLTGLAILDFPISPTANDSLPALLDFPQI